MSARNKVAVIFDNLGPYHVARLSAAAKYCDLLAIEVMARSSEYSWDRIVDADFRRKTLFGPSAVCQVTPRKLLSLLDQELEGFQPSVVVIPGWYGLDGLGALRWARRSRVPLVIMSESQATDFRRSSIMEWVKSCYVRQCNAALVGGRTHADYLVKLGLRRKKIFLGYDVVDNEFFARGSAAARKNEEALRQKYNLPDRYFLVSARFVKKKNLEGLLLAYRDYLRAAKVASAAVAKPWDLVIVGDGPLHNQLEEVIAAERLHEFVHLPGFKQIEDLPVYYGLAECFILPSTTEQWGLVVNEAMASGLPVIVSERCGCAAELVENGRNGFKFCPLAAETLADKMIEISGVQCNRQEMGQASREIIARWSPERFGKGLEAAVKEAMTSPRIRVHLLDSLLLAALARLKMRDFDRNARISL